MKRKWIIVFSLFLFAGLIFLPTISHAEGEQVSYSVKALLPDNQKNSNHSYFDLQVEPNQTQKLKVEIFNHEARDITVQMDVRNASTNQNGIIVYEKTEELDPSLKVPLTDVLTFEADEIVIPSGESKIVAATLEVPNEEFEGIILGGLHFEKELNTMEGNKQGINIQNKYAYVIGVQLSENDEEVLPDLQLTSIRSDLINHRTAGVITIQNQAAVLVKDLSIHAKIYKDGKKEVWREKIQDQITMAPNSSMDVVVDWEDHPIEAGKYRVEVEATHPSNIWNWEETFVVEKLEARQINSHAIELKQPRNVISYVVTGGMTLLVVIVGLLFYIRKLKKTS